MLEAYKPVLSRDLNRSHEEEFILLLTFTVLNRKHLRLIVAETFMTSVMVHVKNPLGSIYYI